MNNDAHQKISACPFCGCTRFEGTITLFGIEVGTDPSVWNRDIFGRGFAYCSNCGANIYKPRDEQNFLWRIGAWMREKRHESERRRLVKEEEGRFEREQLEILQRNMRATEIASYRTLRSEIENTNLYKNWRDEVLKKYGRACMVCGSTENIEVDHRYKSFYAIIKQYRIQNVVQAYECQELWDVGNGAPLCKNHHSQTKSSIAYNNLS